MLLPRWRLEAQVGEIEVRFGHVADSAQSRQLFVQRIEPQRLVGHAVEQLGKIFADRLRGAVECVEDPGIRVDLARFELGDQALGLLEKPRNPVQPDDLHGTIGLVQVRLRRLDRLAVCGVCRESAQAPAGAFERRVDLALYPAERPDVDDASPWPKVGRSRALWIRA